VAAGLLGAGSVFLRPTGDTAQYLADAITTHELSAEADEARLHRVAEEAVAARRAGGARIPGLGHPVHRDEDPRTPRIYNLAAEAGLLGIHLRLLSEVASVHAELTGRHLPINGAGAAGAALVDAGVPPSAVRGFALIARTAGLVAHLVEEAEMPIGRRLWLEIEERSRTPDP
jgi:citrate synthase